MVRWKRTESTFTIIGQKSESLSCCEWSLQVDDNPQGSSGGSRLESIDSDLSSG